MGRESRLEVEQLVGHYLVFEVERSPAFEAGHCLAYAGHETVLAAESGALMIRDHGLIAAVGGVKSLVPVDHLSRMKKRMNVHYEDCYLTNVVRQSDDHGAYDRIDFHVQGADHWQQLLQQPLLPLQRNSASAGIASVEELEYELPLAVHLIRASNDHWETSRKGVPSETLSGDGLRIEDGDQSSDEVMGHGDLNDGW